MNTGKLKQKGIANHANVTCCFLFVLWRCKLDMVGYVCCYVYRKFCKVLPGHDMNNEPMTLQEIAKAEGITHQRVAQILSSALKKIKKALEQKGIKIQDLV